MTTLTQFLGDFPESIAVDLLVVGGGGGGGSTTPTNSAGGGGGAGEFYEGVNIFLPIQKEITITVGSGGAAGSDGNASSISVNGITLSAAGGGGGASDNAAPVNRFNGGSGGGGGSKGAASSNGETSETTLFTFPAMIVKVLTHLSSFLQPVFVNTAENPLIGYNNNGGNGFQNNSANNTGGGGGGAGGAGGNGSSGVRGTAGSGIVSSITGASVTYAAGGRGGITNYGLNGVAGTANTGNGGEGVGSSLTSFTGGSGGSGIVVIAYRDISPAPTSITGSYTTPTRAGYRVYRFTGSGTIKF